jgi:hypothetical protein
MSKWEWEEGSRSGRMSNIEFKTNIQYRVPHSRDPALRENIQYPRGTANSPAATERRVDLCVNRVLSDESDSADRYIALRRTEQPGIVALA